MQELSTIYIALYAVAATSILCSAFVIITVKKFGSKSISSRLVLYLHLSLVLQEIATFPYIFTGNSIICSIIGFVRSYAGLSNIIIVGLMAQVYRNLFLEDQINISAFIDKYAEYMCWVFPLITVLPFSMKDMYTAVDSTWCAEPLKSWEQILWFWVVNLIWTYIVIVTSVYTFAYTIYTVYTHDKEMAKKLVKTIGMYIVISLLLWSLLVSSAFDFQTRITANLSTYICGVLLFLIFLTEKKSLKLLEKFIKTNNFDFDGDSETSSNMDDNNSRRVSASNHHFSWELDDEECSEYNKSRQSSRQDSRPSYSIRSSISSMWSGTSGQVRESMVRRSEAHHSRSSIIAMQTTRGSINTINNANRPSIISPTGSAINRTTQSSNGRGSSLSTSSVNSSGPLTSSSLPPPVSNTTVNPVHTATAVRTTLNENTTNTNSTVNNSSINSSTTNSSTTISNSNSSV